MYILCINKKQFGIGIVVGLLVMCNVELQSTSAQTVAPNLYWETHLNHNSYTTEYPVSAKHIDSG